MYHLDLLRVKYLNSKHIRHAYKLEYVVVVCHFHFPHHLYHLHLYNRLILRHSSYSSFFSPLGPTRRAKEASHERVKRIIRETVLEWVRVNVANVVKIEIFMNQVHADPYYSLWTRSYYQEPKNIYRGVQLPILPPSGKMCGH